MSETGKDIQITTEKIEDSLKRCIETGSSDTRAAIEISGACNGRCLQCYAVDIREQGFMKEEIFSKILFALDRLGYKEAYIVGGEPMLHPNVTDFCRKAKEAGLYTILVTTGDQLNNPDKAKDLLINTDEITISVRSVHPDVHNSVVNGLGWDVGGNSVDEPKRGGFRQTLDALKTLSEVKKQLNLETKISINFDLYNSQEYFNGNSMAYAIVQMLCREGVRLNGLNLQLMTYSGRAKINSELIKKWQVGSEEFLHSLSDLEKIRQDFNIPDVVVVDDPIKLEILENSNEIPENLKRLIVGEVVPAISPNGMFIRRNVVEEY